MKEKVSFENAKILIPTSSGGHLSHMMMLKPILDKHDVVWVTFNKQDAVSQLIGQKKYWCYFPTNRNFFNLIRNFFLAWKILKKEKPDLIISCGAAISIPFFLLGKFFGCKRVYIEVFDRIEKGTLSGKFCYHHCDLFVVQWSEQLKVYPKAKNLGWLF